MTTATRPIKVITCEHGNDCLTGCICVCGINRYALHSKAYAGQVLTEAERRCWQSQCGRGN